MVALYVVLALIGINIATFVAFCRDKRRAFAGASRIPEATLLWLAFMGGSVGALAGQQLLRHKTRKEPFRTILRLIVCLHIAVLGACLSAPLWLWRLAV